MVFLLMVQNLRNGCRQNIEDFPSEYIGIFKKFHILLNVTGYNCCYLSLILVHLVITK